MTQQDFIKELEQQLGHDIEPDSDIEQSIIECFLDGISVEDTIYGLDLEFKFAPITVDGGFFPECDREHWQADRDERIRDLQSCAR